MRKQLKSNNNHKIICMKFKNFTATFLLGMLGFANASALTKPFEVDGITYDVYDETINTACVTSPTPSNYKYYSGMVNIPASVTHNGITYTVTNIDHDAFRGQTELTSVVFPKTLVEIGYKAFRGCPNLATVAFSSSGVLETIGSEAFASCDKITNINLPASLKYIDNHAFEDCKGLKTIKGGASLEILDKAVFKGCDNLVEVALPESVKSIGEMCFWGCSVLRNVTLGSSLEYIGPDAFLDCHQLENVNIPNTVTEIGYEAFRGCWNLASIEIPNSVTTMGYGAFRYCVSLNSVKLSESLKEIEAWSFEQTSLESIDIPNSVKKIGSNAFSECTQLQNINFGNSLEIINTGAFGSCNKLEQVILPEPLTTIAQWAFMGCENLQFVSIPRTAYDIQDKAFSECPSLANVNNLAIVPQDIYNRNVFANSGPDGPVNVHVYEGLYDIYSTTLGWYDIPASSYYSNVNIIADIPMVAIEAILFTEDPIYCNVGEQNTASIKFLPENAVSSDLIWSSSDESVLFVDMYSGIFIGLEEGEAMLTVETADGVSASAKVIVGDGAGVDSILNDDGKETIIYDLFGRRLDSPRKGINIVNGKKVIVK